MLTLEEERLAIMEFFQRAGREHQHCSDNSLPPYILCIMYRGVLILPDNLIDRCFDCFTRVQHRPSLSRMIKKLCAGCALRRVRGDA